MTTLPAPAPATSLDPARTRSSCFVDMALPAASPAWFGAVMGTAILATLSEQRSDVLPFVPQLALGFWAVAVFLLVGFGGCVIARIMRDREVFTESVATPVAAAQWGLVAMGLLAVGSATAAVLPARGAGMTTLAWRVDEVLWVLGTTIGAVTCAVVPWRLTHGEAGVPTTVWGLAVVPPMVSATVGAGIAGRMTGDAKVAMLAVCGVCFVVALTLGTIIFARVYAHHWFREHVPLATSVSAWLPLGVVGQSSAAATLLANQATAADLRGASTLTVLAHGYGDVMLALAVPLVAWACVVTVRGFVGRMPFSPGWWGMTFPLGTLVLGATTVGRAAHQPLLTHAGGVAHLALLGTWSICAVSTLLALLRHRRAS